MKKKELSAVLLIVCLGCLLLPFSLYAQLNSSSSILMMDTTCAEGLSLGNCSSMQSGKVNFIQQNPGIIGSLKEFNGSISYIPWLFNTGFIFGNVGSNLLGIPVGISIASFNAQEFDFISGDGAVLPDKLSINESLFLLGSAINLIKEKDSELYLGFAVKFSLIKIYNYSGTGVAFDTGLNGSYRIKNNKYQLIYGFAFQNISPGVKFIKETSKLPLRVRTGAGLRSEVISEKHVLTPLLEYIYDNDHKIDIGLEYGFAEIIFFRTGYTLLSENDSFSDICLGLGVQYRKIKFDYTIKILNDETVDNNLLYAFSIGYSF